MSGHALPIAAVASFVLAVVLCSRIRSFALRRALLDHPNERSLHQTPTPRLGGIAIVLATWALLLVIGLGRIHGSYDVLVWLGCSVPIAALGLIDDLRPLPAVVRLIAQIGVAAAFCAGIDAPGSILVVVGRSVALPSIAFFALGVPWIVGVLNIFNFMDGMDGLAGAQATGASLAIAAAAYGHGHVDIAVVAAVVGAAAAGFLVHNAPPAKLFMGDAGSTFLGFGFAAFALMGARRPNGIPFSVVPLALSPFLLDGTFTIVRRLGRGERVWHAHRSHLYQRAVATGLGHHDVLVVYCEWIALAAGCSIVGAGAGARGSAAVATIMLAVLLLVWRWVVRRERVPRLDASDHTRAA